VRLQAEPVEAEGAQVDRLVVLDLEEAERRDGAVEGGEQDGLVFGQAAQLLVNFI